MTLLPENIPQELRARNAWVCWKRIPDPEKPGKYKKEPFQAFDLERRASSTNPKTWSDLKTALFMVKHHGMDGIGTVIQDPNILFDFDNCITDGIIDPDIIEMLDALSTYTEFSQSGKGIHAIGKSRKPGKFGERVECYDNARFVYITGDLVPGYPTTINECQAAVNTLYEARPKGEAGPKPGIIISSRVGRTIADNYGLNISDIAFPDGHTVQTRPGRWKGSNPWHGSTTGGNYEIDIPGNWWHCYRNGHDSGGDALIAFAVREGIIRCEDAGPGCLDGKWPEVFETLERFGYRDRTKPEIRKMVVIS